MSIEQAWLVKGWLLAKDAPEPILKAIDEVIADLSTVVVTGSPIDFSIPLRQLEFPAPGEEATYVASHQPTEIKRRGRPPKARPSDQDSGTDASGNSSAPSSGGA